MDMTYRDIQSILNRKDLFFPLAGTRILITGATGLLGSMLIKTLKAADRSDSLGIQIIGQCRSREKAEAVLGNDAKEIKLVSSYDEPCDWIIHTVSPTKSMYFLKNPVETIKASVGSTMEILETATRNKARMVYLSSMEQYGVPYKPGENMTEDKVGVIDHLNIRSSYSESKRLCECLCVSYCSEYGTDVKIARLAQTFGTGADFSDNRMPMQFARSAVEKRDIVLRTEGKSVSNFVYITDAITGILTILVKGMSGQAYNVCNDKETRSVREIAELVANEISEGEIKVCVDIPKTNMGFAPDVSMYLNSDRLRKLGWEPVVTMAEAYRRLTAYLNESRKPIR